MLTEADIAASPAWFPLRYTAGNQSMSLVRLDEAAYAAASFLDQRLLDGRPEEGICSVAALEAVTATLPTRCSYIFHTGHVGSTLISRLVGAHERFFSLREPALLRTFAGATPMNSPLPLAGVLALLSRTWRPAQRPVVKFTSFLSEHADTLLAIPDQPGTSSSPPTASQDRPAAIFVFAQPLNYLRGILAGPNSRTECRLLAPARLERLRHRLALHEWRSEPRSDGELAAMSWLCEMCALHQAAGRHRPRMLWVDFDAFLREPEAALSSILVKLGAIPAHREVEALIRGPLMQRYSKGPQFAYDAALRRDVLAAADRQHAPEISRGLDWLRGTVDAAPSLQALFA